MSALTQIVKRAKQLQKSHPNSKWVVLIKKASAEYRGSKRGKKVAKVTRVAKVAKVAGKRPVAKSVASVGNSGYNSSVVEQIKRELFFIGLAERAIRELRMFDSDRLKASERARLRKKLRMWEKNKRVNEQNLRNLKRLL